MEDVHYWGQALRFPRTGTIPSFLSLLPICRLRCRVSALFQPPRVPAAMLHRCGEQCYPSGMGSFERLASFCKLLLLWYFIKTIEK